MMDKNGATEEEGKEVTRDNGKVKMREAKKRNKQTNKKDNTVQLEVTRKYQFPPVGISLPHFVWP